jgi:hypothetical protein
MTPSDTLRIVIALFIVVVSAWIYTYTYELERKKCTCAIDRRVYFFRAVLLFLFAIVFTAVFRPVPRYIMVAFAVAWFLFIIIGLWFIRDIKGSTCACAQNEGLRVMEQFLYISLVLYIGMILWGASPTLRNAVL